MGQGRLRGGGSEGVRGREGKVKDLTCVCIRPREGRKDTLPPTQEHLLCWAQAAKFSPNVLMLAGRRTSLWGWRGSDGMQTRWVGGGRGLFYSSYPAMEKKEKGRELLLRALLSGRHLFYVHDCRIAPVLRTYVPRPPTERIAIVFSPTQNWIFTSGLQQKKQPPRRETIYSK